MHCICKIFGSLVVINDLTFFVSQQLIVVIMINNWYEESSVHESFHWASLRSLTRGVPVFKQCKVRICLGLSRFLHN